MCLGTCTSRPCVLLQETVADELETAYRSEVWNPDMRHVQQQKQGWSAARVELTTLASKVTLPEPCWQSTVEQASTRAHDHLHVKQQAIMPLLSPWAGQQWRASDWLEGLAAGSVHSLCSSCTNAQ